MNAATNAAMIAGYNALGLRLFRALAQSDSNSDRNIVMSPLSIGVTLAMGLAGAAGETADQMARTLGFDGARPDLFAANADLLRHYAESSAPEAARVRLANALVLTQHGEAVARTYRELLAGSFAAEIFAGDVARINQWVAQRTEGKIERALDSLPQDDIAVLVNAIYFKAPWAKPFNPAATFTAGFLRGYDHDFEKIKIDVQMMKDGSGDYVTAGGPGYRAARLPYKTASLGMIVVLPDEESDPQTALKSLDTAELARLRAALARAEPSHTTLMLPRFRARTLSSLRPALEQAGMALAFDWKRADFSRMTERPRAEIPVAVTDVVHCAMIDVAEEGTEAAAATLQYFHIGGAPPSFIVDRPFLFFVVDETTGAILFQGKIVDPRA
jgi:serine protease inhibitor